MTLQSADYVFNRMNNLNTAYDVDPKTPYKKIGILFGFMGAIATSVYMLIDHNQQTSSKDDLASSSVQYLSVTTPDVPERIIPPKFSPFTKTDKPVNVVLKISQGFSNTLIRYGISPNQVDKITQSIKSHANIKTLHDNHPISIRIEKNNALDMRDIEDTPHIIRKLSFDAGIGTTIEVSGNGERYFAKTIYKPIIEKPVLISGRVNSSLARDAARAGVPYKMITQFIKMFSLNVDFRELQRDDTFEFGLESFYDDEGKQLATGRMSYASLTVNGKKNEIYYVHNDLKDKGEWFNENGMNTKPMLMKTPIDGARLSSGFGMRRHPILGYTRQHAGIDFAAPIGTPIYAAGNGIVVKKYRSSSYGNYVKIRHNNVYDTAYAHMSRFANIQEGQRVQQGQVIGYVGNTGRSTGPHLHYEVHKSSIPINPLSDKVPTVSTVTAEMKRDMNSIKDLIVKLRKGKEIKVMHKSIHAVKHKFI